MFDEQKIFIADEKFSALEKYLSTRNIKKIFLIHGKTFEKIPIKNFFDRLNIPVIHFTDFKANPDYESVVAGVKIFQSENCDAVIAVGGGSAIDVAKCIKIFAQLDTNFDFLQQKIFPNNIPLIVSPTTAGTGAESTHFAVIYKGGNKISVADKSALPNVIVFDIAPLKILPEYQKKSGLLDAICHSLEAAWSVNSNEVAKEFAFEALRLIYANKNFYLEKNPADVSLSYILYASRLAGKAINIAKTTAGHALSYKLTQNYGIAHGQAAALCVAEVWDYMNKNSNDASLKNIFQKLAACMGFSKVEDAIKDLKNILAAWNFNKPLSSNATDAEINILVNSVNLQRLANNPVKLDEVAIKNIYTQILKRSRNEC